MFWILNDLNQTFETHIRDFQLISAYKLFYANFNYKKQLFLLFFVRQYVFLFVCALEIEDTLISWLQLIQSQILTRQVLRGAIDACLAVIIDEIHGQYLILFFYISSIHDWQLFCNLKFTDKLVPINIQSDILAVRQKCGRRIFSVVLYWLFIVFFCETSSTDNIDRPSVCPL